MVLSDPTIDPVTGLPVLNPQDVIQQIPLGVQIFPYDDLEATARPTRGPLYGDDILPVSSLTAGQHPSTGSAQTVGTDGNHRLLVSVDGGSGGGGLSPHELLQRQFGNVVPTGGGTYTFPGAVSLGAVIVVGWDIACIGVDTGGTTINNTSPCMLHLSDTVTLTDYYLGTWFNQYWNGTAYAVGPYNASRFPEIPLDLRPNAADGGGLFDLIVERQQYDLSLNLILWYYVP